MSNIEEEDDDDLEWEEWKPNRISFVYHMMAGSMAGLAEHVSIFPIDTLKTHIQCERCGAVSPFQTWNCATKIIKREGIFRLWRGVSAMFAGCVPAHAAYFSIFENMKIFLGADKEGHHPLKAAFCGAAATFSHDLCMTPFDTVKQRMQLGYYKNLTDCVKSIRATEGIKAFYYSFPTTLMMNLPFGCVMVAVNESARKIINPTGKYNFMASMVAGTIAGTVAAAVTTPLDVIKTKLQTQNLEPCPRVGSIKIFTVNTINSPIVTPNVHGMEVSLSYKSSSQVVAQIFKESGYSGFFRGMGARMLVHAPSVAISWTAYETFKTFLFNI